MKYTNGFILIVLLAFSVPAFGQDEGGAGGGFGGGAFGGGGGFGGDVFGGDGNASEEGINFGGDGAPVGGRTAPKIDVLADLRGWLAKSGASPIEKKQEKPLKSLYDREVKLMAKSFQAQFGVSLDTAIAAQSSAGRGRRGAGARAANPAQTAEITRMKNLLSDKVIAGLRMDQQATLRKYQSEQLRTKEVALLKQKMKAAGIVLSPEQETQVDALYARESRLRTLVIIEANGQPYDVNVTNLQKQTTQRVVQLLNQGQKAVLSAAVGKSKTP